LSEIDALQMFTSNTLSQV